MKNKLLELMFQPEMWEQMIAKMNDDKGLDKTLLRRLCNPEVRLQIYYAIINGRYRIMNTHAALIPKDEPNSFRRVHICEDLDRCLLSIINDCYFKLFSQMIDKHVWSYQKGKSSQEATQTIVQEIVKTIKTMNRPDKFIGYKVDFHHFFDDLCLEEIDRVFDECEALLGFEKGTEPVTRMLKEFYHDDLIFDENGDLVHEYTGIRQGAAISSFLADVILNDIDKEMSRLVTYIRYSDDCLLIGENAEEAYKLMLEMLKKYNVTVNPKKVTALYSDKFFTFLGFKIRGEQITLSKNRVKKLQKEIVSRTLNKPNITEKQAKRNVIKYLYGNADGFSWATACLGTVNIEADLIEIDNFIKDCLRACKIRETAKHKSKISIANLGGLGSVDDLPDRTILRGKGRKVGTYRDRTDKTIQNYKTLNCLRKAYQMNVNIYESVVRSI